MAEKRSETMTAEQYEAEQHKKHLEEIANDPRTLAADALQRERREEREREQEALRQAVEARHEAQRAEAEAADKARARVLFLAGGGTEADFQAAWPGLRAEQLKRRYDAARAAQARLLRF